MGDTRNDQQDDQQDSGGGTIGDRLTEDEGRELLNRGRRKDDQDDERPRGRRERDDDQDDDDAEGDDGGEDRKYAEIIAGRKKARERASQLQKERDALEAKVREYETAGQSESERVQSERDTFKERAAKAEAALRRRELAEDIAEELNKGRNRPLSLAEIKKVARRMAGDTDEQLEEDAKDLFSMIGDEQATSKPPAGSTPKERLKERPRGGADPDEEVEETDPKKILAGIPRSRI